MLSCEEKMILKLWKSKVKQRIQTLKRKLFLILTMIFDFSPLGLEIWNCTPSKSEKCQLCQMPNKFQRFWTYHVIHVHGKNYPLTDFKSERPAHTEVFSAHWGLKNSLAIPQNSPPQFQRPKHFLHRHRGCFFFTFRFFFFSVTKFPKIKSLHIYTTYTGHYQAYRISIRKVFHDMASLLIYYTHSQCSRLLEVFSGP